MLRNHADSVLLDKIVINPIVVIGEIADRMLGLGLHAEVKTELNQRNLTMIREKHTHREWAAGDDPLLPRPIRLFPDWSGPCLRCGP